MGQEKEIALWFRSENDGLSLELAAAKHKLEAFRLLLAGDEVKSYLGAFRISIAIGWSWQKPRLVGVITGVMRMQGDPLHPHYPTL